MTGHRLAPGEIVVRRDVYRDKVWSAIPMVVVADEVDELVAVRVPGTRWVLSDSIAASGMGRKINALASGVWKLEERFWEATFALSCVRPGQDFELIHFFDAETLEFQCWYVNFQVPARRHTDGRFYDSFDLDLDLVVLSGGVVIWKDVEEWEALAASGLVDREVVARVQALRERLVADAEAGREPFHGRWTGWDPSTVAGPPLLPDDWQRIAGDGTTA